MPSRYYIYAIGERGIALPVGVTGLNRAPISAIAERALAAVASTIEKASVDVTNEHLLAHESVVEAVQHVAHALPVRFGTVLPDAEAVRRALAERYDALRADLTRLGDKVEMGLTALFPALDPSTDAVNAAEARMPVIAPSDGTSGPGTRYLRERMAHYRQEATWRTRGEALAASIERALRGPALESRCTVHPGTPPMAPMVRAAFLVAPADLGAFRGAFEALRASLPASLPGTRLLLSGPWPPYSFVTQPHDALTRLSDRVAGDKTHVHIKEEEP
jgi:hypothetical protein